MRIQKPQKLSLLQRVFENDGSAFLVVTPLVYFPFEAPEKLLTEMALWSFVPKQLGRDAMLDSGMNKARGEVLVSGSCFSPGGMPCRVAQVRVTLGTMDKSLAVVGDRYWQAMGPSEPEHFTEMPLVWERAFGGEGYAKNPRGKGTVELDTPQGKRRPLPNIESPKKWITSPRDCPEPQGLLPLDVSWPQRMSKAGTYDQKWLKSRYPGFASDIDWTLFNEAASDQWIQGYFTGEERFSIENMHPTQPKLTGRLPRVKVRVFLVRSGQSTLEEATVRLDTVWLFPAAERGVLCFRALIRVRDDDAADVASLLLAAEAWDQPKSIEHYQRVHELRMHPEHGATYSLRDADLLPPDPGVELEARPEERSELDEAVKMDQLLLANSTRGRERAFAEARERIRAEGLEPDDYLKMPEKEEPLPDPQNIDALLSRVDQEMEKLAQREANALDQEKRAETELKEICKKNGFDYDAMKANVALGGPPQFSAKKEWERLENLASLTQTMGQEMPALAELMTPENQQRLIEQERQLKELYWRFAHVMPSAKPASAEGSARIRAELEARHKRGESLADLDLTGADLAGVRLPGACFDRSFLECCNLKGADLRGCSFLRTVLARAQLGEAILVGSRLGEANLGGADLSGADLSGGVQLVGATLDGAHLERANLSGADLSEASLDGARFGGADFSDAKLPNASLSGCDVAGTRFERADLQKSTWMRVRCDDGNFEEANLSGASFVESKGARASFRRANLDRCSFVQNCEFPEARFDGAQMQQACLRGAELSRTNFDRARCTQADFSEATMDGASLRHADFTGAMCIRTSFREADLADSCWVGAILQKAKLQGASLRDALMVRADMAKVELDQNTDFAQASLEQVRVVQRRSP